MLINNIWKFLSNKEKKKFKILLCLSIFVLGLEILSISSIFPFIYSLVDKNFLDKFFFFKPLYSQIKVDKTYLSIVILFFLLFIVIVKNSFLAFFFWSENKFLYETQEKISKRLFSNLIDKDYSFHLKNNSADLITRIRTDSALIRDSISALFNLIQSIIFIFGLFLFLLFLEPLALTITIITFLLLGSIFNKFTSKKISEVGKIRQKFEIERTKKLQESFSGIKEIKTFLLKNLFIKNYDFLANSIAQTYAVRGLILNLPKLFIETIILIVIIILTILLLEKTTENVKIFALLGVFAVSAVKIVPHINSVLNSLNIIKFSKKSIEYYNNNLKINFVKVNNNLDFNFNNNIIFKNINFRYQDKLEYILENLNFEIKKGDRILLKGKTGAGKSTLIDLILGLQIPTNGEIIVDEINLKNLGDIWLNQISYVPQSIYLFDDTIKNNIVLNNNEEGFDKNHFFKCLEISQLQDFIDKLQNKENSKIGEVGSNISGGQKQRIGIARALYKRSEIIILDEATNALDPQTEKIIFQNLNKLKDKTLIVINHKEIPSELNFRKFHIKEKKLIIENINEKNN